MFIRYNAALSLKQATLDEYPSIATYMDPVAQKLTNDVMTELNAKVDAEGMDPGDVAAEWVKSQGFAG